MLAIATGTLLGYEDADQTNAPDGQTTFSLYLVTNRHVIDGKSHLWIRFNQGAGSQRFRVGMTRDDGSPIFSVSDQFDVAVTAINGEALRHAGADFSVLPDHAVLDLDGIQSLGVAGGDDVFVLGFPMGIAGRECKYAIVRSGVIGRVDGEIVENTGGFLIDCPVYPGNSGGRVVLRPEPFSLKGLETHRNVHVIGIVSGYLPYVDSAISQQTGETRITFQENSGLATVVPIDAIHELVEPLQRQQQLDNSETLTNTKIDG